MTPVCLTWEEFMPPFEEQPSTLYFTAVLEKMFRRLKPIGEGEPFCGKYRLHQGRYAEDEELHNRFVRMYGEALVITFNGQVIGGKDGIHLWLHSEHRYSATKIDLAAEVFVETRLRYGLLNRENNLTRKGRKIKMVPNTIKASKRAYALLVERGYIVPPEGYVVP